MAQDFYKLLGVARDSSEDEIRKAYRKLAHKYHPDKTGGDVAAEDKLKKINEAYDILKNKEKRSQYDRFGQVGDSGFGGGMGAASPFDDIFDAFFSGGSRGRSGARAPLSGDDLEFHTTISLREAATGAEKKVRFKRRENCGECGGSGAARGSRPEICSQCNGAGQVRMAQGFFSITRTCPKCRGGGQVIKDLCRKCRGAGMVAGERELGIKFPPGIDTGSRLRMHGEGEPGKNGGPRGDLYVFIEVEEDEIFERDGTDILCEVPISFSQVILGTTIRVPTLNGEVELKIPAGTQSGTIFKLRGMGMPDLRGYHTGDQMVRIQVETPTKLSREQKELIKRFEELSGAKAYPLRKRFMDKIKASLGS